MTVRLRWLIWICLLIATVTPSAWGQLPAQPREHVSDQARVLRDDTRRSLVDQLELFERETTNQLVVAILPSMPPGETVETYANKLFNHWRIGQKGRNNGVLLLVITGKRELRIEVGYGLEGALPDATARQIIDDEIVPRFKAGDFDGGVRNGVNAIIAATKGEYRGRGRLASERSSFWGKFALTFVIILCIGIMIAGAILRQMYGRSYGRPAPVWARATIGTAEVLQLILEILLRIALSAATKGGSSGGGRSGGFSGGGGSSGGGGASGRW